MKTMGRASYSLSRMKWRFRVPSAGSSAHTATSGAKRRLSSKSSAHLPRDVLYQAAQEAASRLQEVSICHDIASRPERYEQDSRALRSSIKILDLLRQREHENVCFFNGYAGPNLPRLQICAGFAFGQEVHPFRFQDDLLEINQVSIALLLGSVAPATAYLLVAGRSASSSSSAHYLRESTKTQSQAGLQRVISASVQRDMIGQCPRFPSSKPSSATEARKNEASIGTGRASARDEESLSTADVVLALAHSHLSVIRGTFQILLADSSPSAREAAATAVLSLATLGTAVAQSVRERIEVVVRENKEGGSTSAYQPLPPYLVYSMTIVQGLALEVLRARRSAARKVETETTAGESRDFAGMTRKEAKQDQLGAPFDLQVVSAAVLLLLRETTSAYLGTVAQLHYATLLGQSVEDDERSEEIDVSISREVLGLPGAARARAALDTARSLIRSIANPTEGESAPRGSGAEMASEIGFERGNRLTATEATVLAMAADATPQMGAADALGIDRARLGSPPLGWIEATEEVTRRASAAFMAPVVSWMQSAKATDAADIKAGTGSPCPATLYTYLAVGVRALLAASRAAGAGSDLQLQLAVLRQIADVLEQTGPVFAGGGTELKLEESSIEQARDGPTAMDALVAASCRRIAAGAMLPAAISHGVQMAVLPRPYLFTAKASAAGGREMEPLRVSGLGYSPTDAVLRCLVAVAAAGSTDEPPSHSTGRLKRAARILDVQLAELRAGGWRSLTESQNASRSYIDPADWVRVICRAAVSLRGANELTIGRLLGIEQAALAFGAGMQRWVGARRSAATAHTVDRWRLDYSYSDNAARAVVESMQTNRDKQTGRGTLDESLLEYLAAAADVASDSSRTEQSSGGGLHPLELRLATAVSEFVAEGAACSKSLSTAVVDHESETQPENQSLFESLHRTGRDQSAVAYWRWSYDAREKQRMLELRWMRSWGGRAQALALPRRQFADPPGSLSEGGLDRYQAFDAEKSRRFPGTGTRGRGKAHFQGATDVGDKSQSMALSVVLSALDSITESPGDLEPGGSDGESSGSQAQGAQLLREWLHPACILRVGGGHSPSTPLAGKVPGNIGSSVGREGETNVGPYRSEPVKDRGTYREEFADYDPASQPSAISGFSSDRLLLGVAPGWPRLRTVVAAADEVTGTWVRIDTTQAGGADGEDSRYGGAGGADPLAGVQMGSSLPSGSGAYGVRGVSGDCGPLGGWGGPGGSAASESVGWAWKPPHRLQVWGAVLQQSGYAAIIIPVVGSRPSHPRYEGVGPPDVEVACASQVETALRAVAAQASVVGDLLG